MCTIIVCTGVNSTCKIIANDDSTEQLYTYVHTYVCMYIKYTHFKCTCLSPGHVQFRVHISSATDRTLQSVCPRLSEAHQDWDHCRVFQLCLAASIPAEEGPHIAGVV